MSIDPNAAPTIIHFDGEGDPHWTAMLSDEPTFVRGPFARNVEYHYALDSGGKRIVGFTVYDAVPTAAPDEMARYDCAFAGGEVTMASFPDGGWVRHSEAAARIAALEAERDALAIENDALVEDAKQSWSKHGGMEIAKGQWQARAEAAEARATDLQSRLDKALEALKPFGSLAKLFDHMEDDGGSVMVNVSLPAIRAARAIIDQEAGNG